MEGKRFNQKTTLDARITMDAGVNLFITNDPVNYVDKLLKRSDYRKINNAVPFLHCIEAIHKDWFLK